MNLMTLGHFKQKLSIDDSRQRCQLVPILEHYKIDHGIPLSKKLYNCPTIIAHVSLTAYLEWIRIADVK